MIVCHCRAVTDGQIRDVIARGARDEFDVADACGAGGGCGGCVPAVSALLAASGCPVTALAPSAAALDVASPRL